MGPLMQYIAKDWKFVFLILFGYIITHINKSYQVTRELLLARPRIMTVGKQVLAKKYIYIY